MKRILLFIGLKIVELATVILGIGYGPYWLGRWVHSWTEAFCWGLQDGQHCQAWLIGFGFIILPPLFLIIVGGGTILICSANWKWAGKILERKNK